jgi:hypothetical protein
MRFAALLLLLSATGCSVAAKAPVAQDWMLWSQHGDQAGQLWWRVEAGPFTDDECRAEVRRATTRPKVAPTKWYDITPKHLEALYGHAATPDRGTWISCWPKPFDFNRDLVDR